MVREKRADIGQFVNTGTPLAETFATDYAEVRLPLPQTDLKYLDLPGPRDDRTLPATLTADIGGISRTWQSEIVRSEGVFRCRYPCAATWLPRSTTPTARAASPCASALS